MPDKREQPEGLTPEVNGLPANPGRELWKDEALLATALKQWSSGFYLQDFLTGVHVWCPGAREVFGVDAGWEPDVERFTQLIHPQDRAGLFDLVGRSHSPASKVSEYVVEFRIVRGDEVRWIRAVALLTRDELGSVIQERGMVRDVTGERNLAQEFAQVQRQQDLGRLAGGVAHDFNNFLTSMLGEASLALMEPEVPAAVAESLKSIEGMVERAALVTRQLLNYGKRSLPVWETVRVREALQRSTRLLNRVVRESVQIEMNTTDADWPVRVDITQLQQILMNLVVNASDASEPGQCIEVSCRYVVNAHSHNPDLSPGDYVVITVLDSGSGIPPDKLEKVFEPFFTTKAHGTGLGLPTCRAIARTLQGDLVLESRAGEGTTARLFLPALSEHTLREAERVRVSFEPTETVRGRVLVAEDDAQLRGLTLRSLRAFGVEAIEVLDSDGIVQALANDRGIRAVLTDVVMPGVPVKAVRQEALYRWPHVPFLFMSGYGSQTASGPPLESMMQPGDAFLAKPFTPVTLNQRLREILEKN